METKGESMSKGMTLLEIMIVVIIIGILARIALPVYIRAVEKGRSAEARTILGQIRDAQMAYFLEYDAYSASWPPLNLPSVPTSCAPTSYFWYALGPSSGGATATRCISGGRPPDGPEAYTFTIDQSGTIISSKIFM
jgi:prepilin-type N-terminal cleavage/methylation domain-containing protein